MKRHCLTLDLKDDPELIRQYEAYHKEVWPEIIKSITDSGIINMQIYRFETRLFMIMEVTDDFNFEEKELADPEQPKSGGVGRVNVEISTAVTRKQTR